MLDEAGEARSRWRNRRLRSAAEPRPGRGAAGAAGSGRLGHGFGHAGSRHDRHGDAVDGLAELLGGLVERLAHVVGGFIERLANLGPGLRHDPMRVTPASAAARLASRLASMAARWASAAARRASR